MRDYRKTLWQRHLIFFFVTSFFLFAWFLFRTWLFKGFFQIFFIALLGGIAMESPNGAVRLSRCWLTKPTSALGKNATNVNAIVAVDHYSSKVKRKRRQVGRKQNNRTLDINCGNSRKSYNSFVIHARAAGLQSYTHSISQTAPTKMT